MPKAYHVKRFLTDILYPNKCPFCGEVIAFDEYYCCLGGLDTAEDNLDYIALFEYNDKSSPFVYSIKDGGDGYAISAAAKLISEKVGRDSLGTPIDLITCIPTDSVRMRARGYNPPALIAKELSTISSILVDNFFLIKNKQTKIQKSLSKSERQENLKGAFSINKNRMAPKTILLIDDVRTTGATLEEAAGVLMSAGAERVITAVVATVPKPDSPDLQGLQSNPAVV
jgi:ComF family protein